MKDRLQELSRRDLFRILGGTAAVSLLSACGNVRLERTPRSLPPTIAPTAPKTPKATATTPLGPEQPPSQECSIENQSPAIEQERTGAKIQFYLRKGVSDPSDGVFVYTLKESLEEKRERWNTGYDEIGTGPLLLTLVINNADPAGSLRGALGLRTETRSRFVWQSNTPPFDRGITNVYSLCWLGWKPQVATLNGKRVTNVVGPQNLMPSSIVFEEVVPSGSVNLLKSFSEKIED